MEIRPLLHGIMQQSLVSGAPRLTGPGVHLINALKLRSNVVVWSYDPPDGEARDRALLVEQLDLLPRAFPNLQRLELASVYHSIEPISREQLQLLLRPLLQASAKMPALKEFIVPVPNKLFLTIMTLEQYRPAPRQNFVGKRLGDIRIWYPFTERPGKPGQGGGGFWIVYGEETNQEREYDGTVLEQLLW